MRWTLALVAFNFTPALEGSVVVTMRLTAGETLPPRTLVVARPALKAAVSIHGLAFDPPSLGVPPGTNVTWTNLDVSDHDVTAADEAFGPGLLEAGESFSFVFTKPGRFEYSCTLHPTMRGAILVG
jgi:plastocyanin